MKRLYIFFVASALVVAGGFVGLTASASGHWIYENPKEPELNAPLNLGRMNYEVYCASCHGKTARGTDKGPTFISKIYHPGHHGDGAFFVAPKNGVRAHHWPFGDMPPVEGVSDAQLQSILQYVRAVQQANGLF